MVTPLKFPTLRLAPYMSLMSELLPTFGCPTSAIVSVCIPFLTKFCDGIIAHKDNIGIIIILIFERLFVLLS